MYETIERYKQEEFWRFYAENRNPDGENYYFMYENVIVDGKVI